MASPRRRFVLALAVWLAFGASFYLIAARHGGVGEVLVGLLRGLQGNVAGGMLGLFAVYLVRPLFLLPTTLLTAFCGFAYGPVLGLLIAHLAGFGSALVGYLGARYWLGPPAALPERLHQRLRTRGFETVLVSRLAFVPGDLVNAAAGGLRLPVWSFSLATLIGGLPGSVVSVLAGASMESGFDAGGLRLRPGFIVASLALAALSLALAQWLRRSGRSP